MWKEKKIKRFGGYPLDLIIINTDNTRKLHKKYNIILPDNVVAATLRAYKKDVEAIFIVFNTKGKYHDDGVVCHESVHAMLDIFEFISETQTCQEPRSYLTENIFNTCKKFLK